jgi:thiol:disulfide interchange protein/DsbC/DsbD-like thiol-disulfide interchange protein
VKSVGVRAGLLIFTLLSLAEFAVTSPRIARAQERPAPARHVSVSLVAQTRSIVPGHSFHLALRQEIESGWHTYWLNPGDAGLPTMIDWSLPADFKAGPILWPLPKRVAYGPVVDYGYENEVLLPVDIDVPSTVAIGTKVVIAARASWLVCSETCIPEDANLSISVPVAASTEADPDWVERFAAVRARLPLPNPFPTAASVNAENITLHIAMGDAKDLREVMFFPLDRDVIDNDAPQTLVAGPEGLTLTLRRGGTKPPPAALNGLLTFRDLAALSDPGREAIVVSSPFEPVTAKSSGQLAFAWALVFAVAGGVLLNLMPCVLPVLSIKAFSLAQHARAAAREVRVQGISYAAGVLVSFATIAALLLGMRAAGNEIGWGFQLQSPLFVALMIYVLFAVGLNLSGVFSFGERIAGAAGEMSSHPSYSGSFLTGALATLVATPCTAPFMAAAIGYAITQPWYRSLAIFEAVGFGMALPYLAIALSPRLRRFLPKPGSWMLGLKQFLAFPIYGTAVWLTFVLAQESGVLPVTAVLSGLVLIAFAAWLYEGLRRSEKRWRRWGLAAAALSLVGAVAVVPLAGANQPRQVAAAENNVGIGWLPFSINKIDELQAQGRSIFVDVTADWCITCKIKERVALDSPAVIAAFVRNEVAALRADWTRQDPSITRMLEANGRVGVPLYLFYPKPGPRGERRGPIILPQILTAATILGEIQSQ